MAGIELWNTSNNLEQKLGFKMDCPRCRAWNLVFRPSNQNIRIRCEQCGLELIINTESLVNYTGSILPLNY
jgi:ribosomal protein S27E